jgi:hypothetical protein
LLSLHKSIELRVAVLIWLSNVVWSTGIIGGGNGGGVRSGDKTDESIAEWLPKNQYSKFIYTKNQNHLHKTMLINCPSYSSMIKRWLDTLNLFFLFQRVHVNSHFTQIARSIWFNFQRERKETTNIWLIIYRNKLTSYEII